MRVSDLADELGVPTSTVLTQCQRFGIGASWSGAELNGTDVVILRAELADVDAPIDLTGSEDVPTEADREAVAVPPVAAPEPPAAPAAASSAAAAPPLPPTAVGSRPDLIDDVTPDAEVPDEPGAAPGGFRLAGAPTEAADADPSEPRRIPPRPAPERKRLERLARNSAIAFFVGAGAFGVSNFVGNAWAVGALWLLCATALVVATVDGIRGVRRISTHPERLSGRTLAAVSAGFAGLALVGLGFATLVAVRDAPISDAPSIMGDLESVSTARWGAQRLQLIADNGWHRPAKDAGTCWAEDDEVVRDVGRTEFGTDRTNCNRVHTLEVVDVFAYDRDIDSPHPSVAAFAARAEEECAQFVSDAGAGAVLLVEFPGADAWQSGDHDVTCVVRTAPREGSLLDEG